MGKRKITETRIGAHAVQIRREDMRKECLNGQARYEDLLIRIDDNLTGTRLAEIFIHECVHIVADANGIELTERDARTIGLGLGQMLAPVLRSENL